MIRDKVKHFVVGLLATMVFLEIGLAPIVNLALVFLIGIGKEVYDYFDYGKFDVLDILATVSPGMIVYGLLTLTVQ
jgi:hypothetical protein